MYRKQSNFRTKNFGLKISLRRFKFAVDTKKDFLKVNKIYDKLKKAKKQHSYKLKDLVNCNKKYLNNSFFVLNTQPTNFIWFVCFKFDLILFIFTPSQISLTELCIFQ